MGFRVVYNNSGVVPGPSDWDIRLVAEVPPSELAAWAPAGATPGPPGDLSWLAGVPGAEWASGVAEWYAEAGRVVGLDRERSVVVCRWLAR